MTTSGLRRAVVEALLPLSLDASSEARLQAALEAVLAPLGFASEVHTKEGRLDFFHRDTGLCVEVKTKGTVNDLRRQALRYLNLEKVEEVLVISTQPLHRGAAALFRVFVYDVPNRRLWTPPEESAVA